MSLVTLASCTRPFYDVLASGDIFEWMSCPYVIGGLGMAGLGGMLLLMGFIGLMNWSESWTLPIVWLSIMVPAMAATLLPGILLRRIAGIITFGVAMLMIGIYWWWGRG